MCPVIFFFKILNGAVKAVRDPSGEVVQRIQTLIDEEYYQWVASLPNRKPKALRPGPEQASAGSSSRRRRRPRGLVHSGGHQPQSKRQLWRRLYRLLQELYKKNRSRCAKTVLSGDWAKEKRTMPLEEQESYWKPLFEEPSKPDSREGSPESRAMFEMSPPVFIEEYVRVLGSTKESSPSLDGVDRAVLRSRSVLCSAGCLDKNFEIMCGILSYHILLIFIRTVGFV